MGDRRANCLAGLHLMAEKGAWRLLSVSPLYLTEPVDYLDQDWFVNGAARVETDLEPLALLGEMKETERVLGRDVNGVRFGPRPLDMDILFFGNLVREGPDLEIPHPRLHKRRFVLLPLCDIAPKLVHPILGTAVDRLVAELSPDEQEVRPL